MLIETIDARIARAMDRLKQARTQCHPCVIADRERQLDALLDLRNSATADRPGLKDKTA